MREKLVAVREKSLSASIKNPLAGFWKLCYTMGVESESIKHKPETRKGRKIVFAL